MIGLMTTTLVVVVLVAVVPVTKIGMKKMNIAVIHEYNPECNWCKGKGEYRQIVDHDDGGAVWATEKCHCERHTVLVDGSPVEHILLALGYKG